ncbi:MAG: hypothetical protein A2133_12225 [Actinobacteria bacterium RBG_16_64_13]|nr:MAG: hypothetical protein A2133_12225 [Actinobacteria bacterium RBG_16_64_13]
MIKRLLTVVLLLALAVTAGSVVGCGGNVPSDAVAKVGDTLILRSDFDKRVQEFATQYQVPSKEEDPEGWAQFEGDVLSYLVTYEMVVQKADGYGVSVTDEEVQTEIDNIVTTYYQGDQEKFNADLVTNNMTLDQLKLNYRESMMMQKVYEKVTGEVPTPTDEAISAFYEESKDSYFVDETRAGRHILIAPGSPETNVSTTTTTAASTPTTSELTDADWAAALATANTVRTKLAAGGDWTALANEYSDDPSSAVNGGDLGEISKGQMVQEFEDAVFSLKLNEISQPIKTTYGYHVIQVTTINAAKQQAIEEVKEEITSALLNEAKTVAWQKWIEDTKAELGVAYQEGMEPTTTTESTSTTVLGETTSTVSGQTGTTVPASSTTTAGETITTAAPTITTAKP